MHTCLPFCGHNCMRYYPGERDSLLGGRGNKAYHHHSGGWNRPYRKMPPLWRPRGTRRNRESAPGSRSATSSPVSTIVVRRRTREISPFDAQLQRRRFFIRSFFTAEPSSVPTVTTENLNRRLSGGQRDFIQSVEIVLGETKIIFFFFKE